MRATTVFALFACVALVAANCPNGCSGSGTCGANDKCTCYQNYQGADCSLRTCAFSLAWVDTPSAENTAHYYAECGNKGICDRTTGVCACFEGYEGKGCRRSVCANSCSGHGTCEYIEELGSNGVDKRVGGQEGRIYNQWDVSKTQGCKCDAGYEGVDCSFRVCPKGDDPLSTVESVAQKQRIILDRYDEGEFFITYTDPYGGRWNTETILAEAGMDEVDLAETVQDALRSLPSHVLDGVTVEGRTGAGAVGFNEDGTEFNDYEDENVDYLVVSFAPAPGTTGDQHMLEVNIGPTAAGSFPVSAGIAALVTVQIEGTAAGASVRSELITCAGRGHCNAEAGLCECFAGYKGLACEQQEALV